MKEQKRTLKKKKKKKKTIEAKKQMREWEVT